MLNRLFGSSEDRSRGPRGEILPAANDGPPDSRRLSGLCARCGKQSSFEAGPASGLTFDFETVSVGRGPVHDILDQARVLLCRHCRQGVLVIEEKWVGETPWRRGDERASGTVSYRGIHWWPLPEARVSADVPTAIADAFSEALTAAAARCSRAAVVMARRTLEAIATDKGATSGTLSERLNALAKNNVLQPQLAEWAKEVRLVGNIGAHFDPLDRVSEEDARQLLAFIRELVRYLYELPAELARRRQPVP